MEEKNNDAGKKGGFMSRCWGLPWWFLFCLIYVGGTYFVTEDRLSSLLSLLICLFFMLIFMIASYFSDKTKELEKKIRTTGVKTSAEILSVRQLTMYQKGMPYFSLELKYSINGEEVIRPDFQVLVAFTDFDLYKPGKRVELLVDPDNVQNIVLA